MDRFQLNINISRKRLQYVRVRIALQFHIKMDALCPAEARLALRKTGAQNRKNPKFEYYGVP